MNADKQSVDLVFVVDTTGSMTSTIDALAETVAKFIQKLATHDYDYRIAIISFGDLSIPGDKILVTKFNDQAEAIVRSLHDLPRNDGGPNEGESSLEALDAALALSYRPSVAKVAILITDEPALLTSQFSPFNLTSRLALNRITTFVISPPLSYFREMAVQTGGDWYEVAARGRSIDINTKIDQIGNRVLQMLPERRRPPLAAPPPRFPPKFLVYGLLALAFFGVVTLLVAPGPSAPEQVPVATSLGAPQQVPVATSLSTPEQIPVATSLGTPQQVPITTGSGGTQMLLAGQMSLLTVSICLTPTIVRKLTQHRGRVSRVLFETTLFSSILIGFSLWIFGASGLGSWTVYVLGVLLVLEAGSNIIERYMVRTLNRISHVAAYRSLRNDAQTVQKMFRNELILYISVPVGLVAGTIIGLVNNWTTQATVLLSIQIVLLLASITVFAFLTIASVRMSDPIFKEGHVIVPTASEESVAGRKGFVGSFIKVLRVLVPPSRTNKNEQEEQDLTLAIITTELRKAYLYDSTHNAILLFAFALIILELGHIPIDTKWMVTALLGLILFMCQLPYIIGQSLLHEKVRDRYEGLKREEMAENLRKKAPLLPTVDFLAALFTTGTAGGVIYYLLDQFIKNTLK